MNDFPDTSVDSLDPKNREQIHQNRAAGAQRRQRGDALHNR
jgi:hypothetical protein